jgi:hypothetical protein
MGVQPGELGVEQEDLRRVKHPHEQHDDRTGRAETRCHVRNPVDRDRGIQSNVITVSSPS